VIFSDISILYEEQGNLLETFTNQLDDRLNNRLNALTAATANLGVVFQVPKNMVIEKPFKIVIKIDGFANYLPFQFYINLQRSSSAKLVIEFISEESTSSEIFSSTILDGKLEDAASLNLVEIQALNSKVLFFPNERILLEKNAILNWFLMDKGSLVTQRTLSADNSQHGAEAKITGVYIPSGNQHFYYDTKQNQLASDTISNLLFKGVLDEASFALWQGNILVKNGTHGADGYQLNNNLILSPSAYVQSIPGLEISTDDVKCSHGVTISDVDKEQLFYLKSRGIKESQGKALIVDGFIRAAINRIKSTELQNYVIDFLGTERTDI
jgi:Fe-S cluster assembly protein SufD